MKFIKILILNSLLLCVGISTLNGQNYQANDAIAKNKKVKKGVLSNGMTYYIYPTAVNKGTASYYIIQNVGSILENDKQKGLAHFLEHMAFNGTKNFPKKGILETLQKHGAAFGQNINAYTGYDETVYNFDNIPSTDPKVVDDCLLILHDWSNSLSLTNEEIDAERGIIVEEWRGRQNASARIFNQFTPYLYNHSLYADRSPIGDMDIVKNFDYEALRSYYKDWYRPDLQAIAVVGDINVEEIEQKIKILFANIPTVKNPFRRFEIEIPDHQEPFYKLAVDKENTSSNISFMITQNGAEKSQTFNDLKQAITRSIALNIINSRLSELSQKEDCAFLNASASYSNFTRLSDALSFEIAPKPNKQAAAFALAINEFARAKKFGFSDGEIQRMVATITSFYENYIQSENEIPHQYIINNIKGDYLSQQLFPDVKSEFEMAKQILNNIDSNTLQEELTRIYTQKNRVITVTGLESETNLLQEEAFTIISKSENNTELKAYEDTFSEKSLMTDVTVTSGKIISEITSPEIDATTYTLSNGVKVHYKFANKNVNDVQLKAESFGGSSLYELKDIPSLNLATSLAQASGLGVFSATDLGKVLSGKTANVSINIGNLTETVTGNTKTKDLETMMQLVHLRFVKPRFDAETFEIMKSDMQNSLNYINNDISAKMRDGFINAVYGKNSSKIRVPNNQQYVDDISFEKIKTIYQERFCDVSNFEFYIVGDVTPEVLKPLIEQYIASINGIKRIETFKEKSIPWISNKIDQDISIKMEVPKSTVGIQFESDYNYNQKNSILASMLGEILSQRYIESLREKEGGTYGANVSASIVRYPKSKGMLSVNFDCDADNVEKLVPIVYQEIEKIKKGEFVKEDLEKTKTNFLKVREDSKNFNNYSMDLVYEFFQNKININAPANYVTIVKLITEIDIQNFAISFLSKAKSYEIIFKPL